MILLYLEEFLKGFGKHSVQKAEPAQDAPQKNAQNLTLKLQMMNADGRGKSLLESWGTTFLPD